MCDMAIPVDWFIGLLLDAKDCKFPEQFHTARWSNLRGIFKGIDILAKKPVRNVRIKPDVLKVRVVTGQLAEVSMPIPTKTLMKCSEKMLNYTSNDSKWLSIHSGQSNIQ